VLLNAHPLNAGPVNGEPGVPPAPIPVCDEIVLACRLLRDAVLACIVGGEVALPARVPVPLSIALAIPGEDADAYAIPRERRLRLEC
jgi:hypothetical protein